MSTIPSFTKYNVNPTSIVCVNPQCAEGAPRYKNTGKRAAGNCYSCGKSTLRRIQGEPAGTYHPPQR